MTSSISDILSTSDTPKSTHGNPKPYKYNKYGIQFAVPTEVFYLNGTPSSMWLQLGNLRLIQKLQKHLNDLTNNPLSTGFSIKPQVGKLYSIKWTVDERFYRAQIENEIEEETYIARFVDYGCDEVVFIDQIYHLPEKHRDFFEQLPPQSYNCCLKGFEDENPGSATNILNATSMSPQNMQIFEHLLQSCAEKPSGTFMPNPNIDKLEDVPPYVVTITAQVNVNLFVESAKLMQPYIPYKLGCTTVDIKSESYIKIKVAKEDEISSESVIPSKNCDEISNGIEGIKDNIQSCPGESNVEGPQAMDIGDTLLQNQNISISNTCVQPSGIKVNEWLKRENELNSCRQPDLSPGIKFSKRPFAQNNNTIYDTKNYTVSCDFESSDWITENNYTSPASRLDILKELEDGISCRTFVPMIKPVRDINTPHPFVLNHFESLDRFYVHLLQGETTLLQGSDIPKNLVNEMDRYYESNKELFFTIVQTETEWWNTIIAIGRPYLVAICNEECWYRGEIIHQDRKGQFLMVHLIDYGDVVQVDKPCNVLPLVQKFRILPRCALLCKLKQYGKLNDNSISRFHEIMEDYDNYEEAVFITENASDLECKILPVEILIYKPCKNSSDEVFVNKWIEGNNNNNDNRSAIYKSKCSSNELADDEQGTNVSLKYSAIQKNNSKHIQEVQPSAINSKKEPNWDPMKEEFMSGQNLVASKFRVIRNENYETSDGKRICKFYRSKGLCFRGNNCEYLHVFTGSDFHNPKSEMIIVPERLEDLPRENDFAIIQLGHVNHPGHFFVNMPFGRLDLTSYKDVFDLNECLGNMIKNKRNFLSDLQSRMSTYYESKMHNIRNELSSFLPGEIVAINAEDGQWCRARIIDTEVHPDPFIPLIRVQYVDYGSTKDVRITDVRKIDREFLDLKFQALECNLEGVIPKIGSFWSQDSAETLRSTIGERCMIAQVKKKYTNDLLGLKIYQTGSLENIAGVMVQQGVAKFDNRTKDEEVDRIPG